MSLRKRGIYEKIINIILDILIVLFGIFLLISIYNNVQIKILGNSYSSFFGYSTFEVQTGSMADTINPGDWIVVKSVDNIKLDDIVTYAKNGDFITHRVVETYKDTFVTKGDANNSKDDPINKSQVVGRVIKILPGFGIIRKTFFNPLVLITLIITLYSVSYVLRSTKHKDNDDKKKFNYREKIDCFVSYVLTKMLDYVKKHVKNNDDLVEKKDEEQHETSDIEFDNVDENIDFNIQLPEINKEDMDKTLYFRTISVEKKEIDSINEESVKEEVKEPINNVVEVEVDEIEEKVRLIQNKKKKFKNIVEKAIYFKREELYEIIDILCFDEKIHTNEPTIKEEMLNAYIDGKYYNHCGNINVDFNKKNVVSRIDNEVKNFGEILKEKYKGSDNKYADKVDKFVNIFLLINNLEYINVRTSGVKEKRDGYRNKILKYLKIENLSAEDLTSMINQILRTQKVYQSMINYILDKANSNVFNLILNNISGKKDMYVVSLEHNIMFSKVYSEYIVDKTYAEGIIAEDKVMVLLNLLLTNIVRDMYDLDENKKYFIHIPNSIYDKPNKLDKIFKMFEDEYAKNNIVVVVEYESLVDYSNQIISLRKKGYHFAMVLKNEFTFSDFNHKYAELAEYLFVNKNIISYNLISSLPENLADSIINDDVMNKLSSFGGE